MSEQIWPMDLVRIVNDDFNYSHKQMMHLLNAGDTATASEDVAYSGWNAEGDLDSDVDAGDSMTKIKIEPYRAMVL